MNDHKTRPIPGTARHEEHELRAVAQALVSPAASPRLRVVLNELEAPPPLDPAVSLSSYLAAIVGVESARAQRIVSELVVRATTRQLVFEFVLPALHRINEEVARGALGVGHEHLVLVQLRLALLARLRTLDSGEGAPQVVVTSPAGHHEELGALMSVLLAQQHGFHVVYLGVDLPDDQIVWCVRACAPRLLMLGVSRPVGDDERTRLGRLFAALPSDTAIWVGGRTLVPGTFSDGVLELTNLAALDAALARARLTRS